MNDKELIKKTFEEKFNQQELKEKILNKKPQRNYAMILVPVFLLFTCLPMLNQPKTIPDNKDLLQDAIDTTVLEKETYIDINDYRELPVSAMDYGGYGIKLTFEEFKEKFSFIHDDILLKNIEFESYIEHYSDDDRFLGYYLGCSNNEGKGIVIFFSETLTHKLECVPIFLDSFKDSLIEGMPVKLFSSELWKRAFFDYQGYHFDIELYQMSVDEMVRIILSIIR